MARTSTALDGSTRARRGITLPLLAALAIACRGPEVPAGSTVRVLFVGNSLTYVNDLPGMVRALAEAGGAVTIETRDASLGGYSLEDHWATPESRDALAEGGWDVVVLQQGPSALPESQVNLIQWAGTWADAIRAQGGMPALYMVWPDRARITAFDSVSTSYRLAPAEANAQLHPAGADEPGYSGRRGNGHPGRGARRLRGLPLLGPLGPTTLGGIPAQGSPMPNPDPLLAPLKGAEHREAGGVELDIVRVGSGRVKRTIYPRGFRWSADMKPLVGTSLCMHAHVGFLARGRIKIQYGDGCTKEFTAPQAVAIEPGHDGWVLGNEEAILIEFDFEGDTARRFGMPETHEHGRPTSP
jgi:hypothetical protein